MLFRRRQRQRDGGRREWKSIEEAVIQIARDKSISRFNPRLPDAEKPRDVFMRSVTSAVEPLIADGWRFASSGPHATLRMGDVRCKVTFGSSSLNVAGALVSLYVTIIIRDAQLGAWRAAARNARRHDDVIVTRQLGQLLDPPRWLEWNLADPRQRPEVLADIADMLQMKAVPYVNRVMSKLRSDPVDPQSLAGLVDPEAMVEYYVRAGMIEQTGSLIATILEQYDERATVRFDTQVARFRSEGLPDRLSPGVSDVLAYLAVQHDLPAGR